MAAFCISTSTIAERQQKIAPTASSPGGEKRFALIIGNAAYTSSPLRNPVNDARAIAKALAGTGFTVTALEDATQATMVRAIRQFGDELAAGGVGLFYYAGHGMQVRGKNFLIPVNADIQREDEVEFNAVDANFVVAKMDTAKNGLNLLILDACRNNPFARSFRSGSQGLAQMDAPSGTLVAFATAPGSIAADGDGQNGLYTKHLLANLAKPGLPIEQLFKEVRNGVARETAERQIPWESSSLRGNFFFVPADPAQSAEAQKAAMDRAIAAAVKHEQDKLAEQQRKMEETIRQLLAKQRAELEEEMRKRGEALATAAPRAPAPTPAPAPVKAAEAPKAAARPAPIEKPAPAPGMAVVASAAPTPIAAGLADPRYPKVGDRWEYRYVDVLTKVSSEAAYEVTGVSRDGILEAGGFAGPRPLPRAHSHEPLLYFTKAWDFSPYMLALGNLAGNEHWPAIPAQNHQPCMGLARCRFEGRVAGREKVTTAAGTFDAIKVVIDMNGTGQWGTGTANQINTWRQISFWYAPQVKRWVKSTARTRSGPTVDADYDMELVSYKLN